MFQELDDTVIEYGTDAVIFPEEVTVNHEVDKKSIKTPSNNMNFAVTSEEWTVNVRTRNGVEVGEIHRKNALPDPKPLRVTGVKQPHVELFEKAVVTSVTYGDGCYECEFLASGHTTGKLWK